VNEPRIGVDARPLCHPGTGIYRYTLEILKRVCGYGGEWFLYSPQAYDRSALLRPNIHHRIAGVPSWLRASQSAQVFFPIWVKRDQLSVFWGPRHQLPLFLPPGIRGVVTIHDLVWKKYGETMRFPGKQIDGYLMPKAMRRADIIVAVSDFTRHELHRYFPEITTPVKVVPGASHLKRKMGRSAPDGDGNEPYFLFVGTMEPRKNLPVLLSAYKEYAQLCTAPVHLKIVGGRGWGGVDANELVRQLALEAYVTVVGKVTEQELCRLYSQAYALVMPSLYEGFGLPVVESLSMGIPVITSRDSAMSEVAGSAGLYIEPESIQDVAGALLKMTNDQALYAKLRQRTCEEAGRYDWDRSAREMADILLL
jgi:glycosyltransferase involved in cell wall biosynthesis